VRKSLARGLDSLLHRGRRPAHADEGLPSTGEVLQPPSGTEQRGELEDELRLGLREVGGCHSGYDVGEAARGI